MYNFKKFVKTSQRSEDRITVTTSNSFGFPTKFYKDNKINQYKYVVVYYDEEQKAVGLHFTNDEEEKHKFSILRSKQGYGGSIVATSFFKTNNLNPKIYRGKYEWEKTTLEGVGDLFVIKLREKEREENKT